MYLMLLKGTMEIGIIFAVMALGVFISFRTLNMPDLTVDGSFVTGAAVSALMCTFGQPVLGFLFAFVLGCAAGCITALLHTKLKIQALLAGILTMFGLYSINLKVMLNKANIPLVNKTTVFNLFEGSPAGDYWALILSAVILFAVTLVLYLFLMTKIGFALRATGDNDQMVRALGVNTDLMVFIGLSLSNGFVALSGAVYAQYQSFADISMGTGMVIIGLASVIIGEVIFGTKPLLRRLIAVIAGAILYRFAIAIALELGMPPNDLKLISALIVALALAMPVLKTRIERWKKRMASNGSKGGHKQC